MRDNNGVMGYGWDELKKGALKSFRLSDNTEIVYYALEHIKEMGISDVDTLPFSIRIVLESLLRNLDGKEITLEDLSSLARWDGKSVSDKDIPFKVSRVLMQDFTGVPAVVDLAAIREYASTRGVSPEHIQPIIPVDLIIDHSVQVDAFNVVSALHLNQEKEIERNKERYTLLKWASNAFLGFRVFPPSAGICHQVNLEYLGKCVRTEKMNGMELAFPDTLVGTDSHTTMINGLGILGFGVGGIEAEAALLGQAVSFTTPKVLGVRLRGKLNEGVTATDFALTLTKRLREKGVVNMFVEFFGDGVRALSLPDRATLSNMCPEYGATIAIFPVDEESLRYMKSTGRDEREIEIVRKYYENQKMFEIDYSKLKYSDILDVDLSSIVPSVSGPSQPKQEVPLQDIKDTFMNAFMIEDVGEHDISSKDYTRWSSESQVAENGSIKNAPTHRNVRSVKIKSGDGELSLSDGDVVISSITSCTNTSNPSVMIGAGLLAKKALERGLRINTKKVKTSFGPGSRVVPRYLELAGLMKPLEELGYGLVGFGCITCIGNSGPLIEGQSDAIISNNLAVAAVLSGNRNYEARIHRDIRANYLMSPPLLIAFGIAGSVLKDLTREPLGKGKDGEDVYLKDIWPSQEEINEIVARVLSQRIFKEEYGENIFKINPYWNKLEAPRSMKYGWEESSSYIRLPPFFDGFDPDKRTIVAKITGARVLALFGDSISTDHISPAGAIGQDSPAGKYLSDIGVKREDFNTYGSRRGNHEVMMRGTFANNRIKNLLLSGTEGGFTVHFPSMEKMSIFDAAMKYKEEKIPLVIIAGIEYGSGSSRDWAAKGPALLGVKAVIARSFERIHRSNLVGMGVLPLQFKDGEDHESLGIDCTKEISIEFDGELEARSKVLLRYRKRDGREGSAELLCRIDTPIEMEYYRSGGILNYVIRKILGKV